MIRNLFYLIGIVALLAACDDDESVLLLDRNEVTISAAGEAQKIEVKTNEIYWQMYASDDWVKVERDSCYLILSAENNPTRATRTAKVNIVAGDSYVRVWVSQPGSSRAVGELYPNAENPIGIIYKLTDGGEHGYIFSLDEFYGKWGDTKDNDAAGKSRDDGVANTRYFVETYKDSSYFATEYELFHWVYQVKNGGDMNGKWYIPAYNELRDLFAFFSGSNPVKAAPSTSNTYCFIPDRLFCQQITWLLESVGGESMKTATDVVTPYSYWSSTGYSKTNAMLEIFRYSNASTAANANKSSKTWYARAIQKF